MLALQEYTPVDLWIIVFTNDGHYSIRRNSGEETVGSVDIMSYIGLRDHGHRTLSIEEVSYYLQDHHPLAFAAAKNKKNEGERARALKALLIKAVEETQK